MGKKEERKEIKSNITKNRIILRTQEKHISQLKQCSQENCFENYEKVNNKEKINLYFRTVLFSIITIFF